MISNNFPEEFYRVMHKHMTEKQEFIGENKTNIECDALKFSDMRCKYAHSYAHMLTYAHHYVMLISHAITRIQKIMISSYVIKNVFCILIRLIFVM